MDRYHRPRLHPPRHVTIPEGPAVYYKRSLPAPRTLSAIPYAAFALWCFITTITTWIDLDNGWLASIILIGTTLLYYPLIIIVHADPGGL
ncbi:MAG: hypothetical protein ACK5LN_03735 [Propioniciclava sp.]